MNLDELRSVQSKERQTDSLQHLRESFYEDVSAYISDLEAERDAAAAEAEDPFADPSVRRLTDEIETAREVVEAIYDRRLGKLVKRASLAAADMPADAEGLTAEERDLFEDLVERIGDNKAHVLDVLDDDRGEGLLEDAAPSDAHADGAPDDAEPTSVPGDAATGADPAGLGEPASDGPESDPEVPPDSAGPDDDVAGDGGTGTRPDRPADEAAVAAGPGQGDGGALGGADHDDGGDRTTVRITGDVDEFYGVDQREYDLDPETVVDLPAENARPLLEAGDAERID